MPKFFASLGAVAIIAFSIGFNMARYPSVWEMVGPSAHLPRPENPAEAKKASQSIKSGKLVTAASAQSPSATPAAEYSPEIPSTGDREQIKTNYPAGETTVNSFISSHPLGKLVAVPGNLLINGPQPREPDLAVQRLPPVYQSAPLSAGRYAAEYPQSPIPIYPSTGK